MSKENIPSVGGPEFRSSNRIERAVLSARRIIRVLNKGTNEGADEFERVTTGLAHSFVNAIRKGSLEDRIESSVIPPLLVPVGIVRGLFYAGAVITGGRQRHEIVSQQ